MSRELTEPPKKWFHPDGSRRRGVIPPTHLRASGRGPDHLPPASGVDRTGAPWLGTSRIVNRAKRRKANRLSWATALRRARQVEKAAKTVAEA